MISEQENASISSSSLCFSNTTARPVAASSVTLQCFACSLPCQSKFEFEKEQTQINELQTQRKSFLFSSHHPPRHKYLDLDYG